MVRPTEPAGTALEQWLRVKPYLPAQLARCCGIELHTMIRAIRGAAALDDRTALALAGLLGVPFEEIFEVRSYRRYNRACSGWFARRPLRVGEHAPRAPQPGAPEQEGAA
jgi:hypothetical protein